MYGNLDYDEKLVQLFLELYYYLWILKQHSFIGNQNKYIIMEREYFDWVESLVTRELVRFWQIINTREIYFKYNLNLDILYVNCTFYPSLNQYFSYADLTVQYSPVYEFLKSEESGLCISWQIVTGSCVTSYRRVCKFKEIYAYSGNNCNLAVVE